MHPILRLVNLQERFDELVRIRKMYQAANADNKIIEEMIIEEANISSQIQAILDVFENIIEIP